MIRIAVVGDIGSGKTYVAKLFGLPVFNADKEVVKIYRNSRIAYKKLRHKLPKFIFSFPIKKEQIGSAVKDNSKNLKTISKIIHPIVRKRMFKFLKKHSLKKAVVLDIPLYFENKINKKKDIVIYVSAKKKLINFALKKRNKLNFKLIKKLGKLQKPLLMKKKNSNYVIVNDFKSRNLKKRVKKLKYKIFDL